ncbi:MAG: hypothetical protein OEW48_14340 [Phycisphaerae bacterium]|nr:hypothetical protein [Phycisphaerae bacterium]
MKSLIRTIIVLAVFGFVMAAAAPAPGVYAGKSDESGNQASQPGVPTPSQSTEPATPPPSAEFVSPASDEFAVTSVMDVADPYVYPSNRSHIVSTLVGGKSSNMLVIPDTEIKAEDVAAITQDMQVMSHIFDKIFQGPRLIEGMFRDYGAFFGRGSRATQAIYLQGYGTLFLLEVDFPFSPPPKSAVKEEQPEETDSVWQQAKEEIFSPTQFTRVQPSEDKYDAEKVKELKSRLVKALKHTANIRNIKPEEWIILTVHGADQKAGGIVTYEIHTQGLQKPSSSNRRGGFGGGYGLGGGAGGGGFGGGGIIGPGQQQASQGSVMTIRAKKSDVDDYANGKLDLEQFKEKVQILVY